MEKRIVCHNCNSILSPGSIYCPQCGTKITATDYVWGNAGQDNPIYLRPGTVLHTQYRVNSVIGQGGFGITYDGTDIKLNMHVAIKEYFPNPLANRQATVSMDVTCNANTRSLYEQGMKNFLEEARNMARFAGEENFVSVHDYFAENQTAYIVMEFVEGQNLKEYMAKTGPLTIEQSMPIIIPVMNALEKIHANNMIHRDISPSNIMILNDGRVRLLDFGAAKEVSMETVGMTTMSAVYKYGYSPIEQQTRGMRQGPYTDIYALCATIYEMLTGMVPAHPFKRAYEGEELVPPSRMGVRINKRQENAILKGLEINGADRIQTIAELRAALCGADSREPAYYEADDDSRRKGIIAILGIIAAALLVILIGLAAGSGAFRRKESSAPSIALGQEDTGDSGKAESEETESEANAAEEPARTEQEEEKTESETKIAESDAGAITVADQSGSSGGSGIDKSNIPDEALFYDENYYMVYDVNGVNSWQQAEDYCEGLGGHLAVITSDGLNDELYRLVRSNGYSSAFFGFSDVASEGHWRWVTQNQPGYRNWGPTEPNSASYAEDFAMFSTSEADGTWNDSEFGFETTAFICQWGDNNIDHAVVTTDIPDDAIVYNGHSYYIFDNGMGSWAEAQQYCMSRGGDMAVINDSEENEMLYDYMLSMGLEEAFFGYTDKENEGYWSWVSADTSTFEDWGVNDEGEREPNNDHPYEDYAEFYVGMRDGHWNDSRFGYDGTAYICEWNTTP